MKPHLVGRSVSRSPIIGALILCFAPVSYAPISAQISANPKSPKEVLQAYRKMDAAGERLTVSGWYRASDFFVKPARPPQERAVAIMDGERVDDPDPWFKENNKAHVSVTCSAIGQLDSSGRFTSRVAPDLIDSSGRPFRQPGVPQIHGPAPIIRVYEFVLTDTHWEFGRGRDAPREVKGPPEWRIEHFEMEPWVTIEVAIRYLEQLRDGSSSEVIKRNAEKSIAVLRGFL